MPRYRQPGNWPLRTAYLVFLALEEDREDTLLEALRRSVLDLVFGYELSKQFVTDGPCSMHVYSRVCLRSRLLTERVPIGVLNPHLPVAPVSRVDLHCGLAVDDRLMNGRRDEPTQPRPVTEGKKKSREQNEQASKRAGRKTADKQEGRQEERREQSAAWSDGQTTKNAVVSGCDDSG